MDYDRRASVKFDHQVGKPGEADDALGQAYRALINFKLGMDAMEEIPNYLKDLYPQTMKAIDLITNAQRETYQLRMMTKKALARYGM